MKHYLSKVILFIAIVLTSMVSLTNLAYSAQHTDAEYRRMIVGTWYSDALYEEDDCFEFEEKIIFTDAGEFKSILTASIFDYKASPVKTSTVASGTYSINNDSICKYYTSVSNPSWKELLEVTDCDKIQDMSPKQFFVYDDETMSSVTTYNKI